MIDDFEKGIALYDEKRVDDYVQSAIEKDGWQKEYHNIYPVTYPYIHQHVFDDNNIRQLFNYVFDDVINDAYVTEEFSDNVVIAGNRLNRAFSVRNREKLEMLMNGTVLIA